MKDHSATRVLLKFLSENDNSKNQIYLGGSFRALNQVPFGEIRQDTSAHTPNYKAPVELRWISKNKDIAMAPAAQLILYPDYPEVRLSGFLRGCSAAPSQLMKPIPRSARTGHPDGRILALAVCPDDTLLGYIASPTSDVAKTLREDRSIRWSNDSIFTSIDIGRSAESKTLLLLALGDVVTMAWHFSCRLNSRGELVQYGGQNAGGYTLEALLGVTPNSVPGPDILGWEIKAYTQGKITLMTPEPDGGVYQVSGVVEFLNRFGHEADSDTRYFTGTYRIGVRRPERGLTLRIVGYDLQSGKILQPDGGIALVTDDGEFAAVWSYPRLIKHWARKHDRAAYVHYESRQSSSGKEFRYLSDILLGEGTEFSLFMNALARGTIVYDPGTRLRLDPSGKIEVKKRNQFRVNLAGLRELYHSFRSQMV